MTTQTAPITTPTPLPAAPQPARHDRSRRRPLFDRPIVTRAMRDAVVKLHPRHMVRNPVMFVVLLASALSTLVLVRDAANGRAGSSFTLQISLWLWFTVLFANFAEAMAEGRGKAQADALRSTRTQTHAKRLDDPSDHLSAELVLATHLRQNDVVARQLLKDLAEQSSTADGTAPRMVES